MRLTEALLQHASTLRFDDLPPEAVAATRVFVMDSAAVGISGSGPQVPLTQVVRRSAASYGKGAGARVWVTGEALPAASAAMVNGYQIHSQEFDCVHMPAVVHPLAVIQSALFAAAEQRANVDGVAVDGKALITALNVAVDVATLIGISGRAPMRFFRPSMCGALGAAAGIAHLHGADEELLRRALGLTYSHLSGTMQAHVEGSPTLALQVALNSRAALCCWELARNGFPAPREMLEGPFGYLPLIEGEFDVAPSLHKLAAREPQMLSVSHKVFPTGGAAHAAQDMLMELRQQHGLTLDNVARIELQAPPLVRRLVGRAYQPDMETSYARLCLPFLLGTVLRDGKVGLSAYAPQRLADPALAAFAPQVSLVPNDCDDPNALVPQSMTVTLRDGRVLHNHRDAAIGSPQRPLSRVQQLEKFHHCLDHAARPFDAAHRDALISHFDHLQDIDDVRRLVDLLIVETP
ncbi:MmgE/PrpD family protein [Stenotrophomonas sp. JC08]|uniref:MmgE/PrpD family protein n=1 Tax=Stenotrophomonas sp. JC08 TaxID=3445779 RepID=UPI003FA311EA